MFRHIEELKYPQVAVLFFALFVIFGYGASQIIVTILNSRYKKNLAKEPLKPREQPYFYHLTCIKCSYEWKMTIDEWEQEGNTDLGTMQTKKSP